MTLNHLFASLLLTACMLHGVRLRYAPFSCILQPEQKRRLLICYSIHAAVNIAVLFAGLELFGPAAGFTYLRYGGILYALSTMLINMVLIRHRIREHLFVTGIVLTCNYLLMTVPNLAMALLPNITPEQGLFLVVTMLFAVLCVLHHPLRVLLCDTVSPYLLLNEGEYWRTVWFIPIAFFGTKFLSIGGEHNTGSIRQLLSAALYICVVVFMCRSIIATQARIHHRNQLQRQLTDQKVHYAELKVRVEDARRTKHDLKNHIAAIRHFVETDDKAGLSRFCDELIGRLDARQGAIPYTGNAAVDGVFYYYLQQAQDQNVDFRYSGTIHSPGIADVDLCTLLGNALDNAMDACRNLTEGRSIAVISQSEPHLLSIAVHNSFDGVMAMAGKDILSRKRKGRTGVGLSSMRDICERYGGSMQTQWDETSFTVLIMLPLTGKTE